MRRIIDLGKALKDPIYKDELKAEISDDSRCGDTAETALNKLFNSYNRAKTDSERKLAAALIEDLSCEMYRYDIMMSNNLAQNRLMFAGGVLPDLVRYEIPVHLEKKHFSVTLRGMSYRFPYSNTETIDGWLTEFNARNDAMDEARGRFEIEGMDLVTDADRELARLGFHRHYGNC